jgi:SAM-dependent methyltransferase
MSGDHSALQPAGDFEFSALESAGNYRAALAREFRPWLRGRVLEVGAGIGQFTELLLAEPAIAYLQAIEPEARFAEQLRRRFPGLAVVAGTIAGVPVADAFDAVVSINVLEHIADDDRELAAYHQRLAPDRGVLCLFVPAGPGIFGSIDDDFGHCRRYRCRELRSKLESAGFRVQRLAYFNLLGNFAWWWNFRVRRRHAFAPAALRLFDRFLFPVQHALESRLLRPPLGQSLIAVAVAG